MVHQISLFVDSSDKAMAHQKETPLGTTSIFVLQNLILESIMFGPQLFGLHHSFVDDDDAIEPNPAFRQN